MPELPIRAEQIEGLEEFLRAIVREEIARAPLAEDVEQLKKTPAGAVIRLEEQVKAVAEDVREIKSQINNLESRMATKDQLAQCATKEELNIFAQEIRGLINALDIRIEEQGKRLAFFQTVTYSILGVLFAMIVTVLVKLFF